MPFLNFRACVVMAMMLTSGLVAIVADNVASAANGDQLVSGSVTIAPGNPCGINGSPGGVAVKQAGTASRLFYATNQTRNISLANAFMGAVYTPACSQIVPVGVTGTAGWGPLAYDATRNLLWAVRSDGSGSVVALTMSGTVVASFTAPAASPTGMTVDEGSAGAHDLLLAFGSPSVARYTVSPASAGAPGYSVARQAQDLVLPDPAFYLASWQGALLASDQPGTATVRNYDMNGAPLGLSFRPGSDYVDPWFQRQHADANFYAMAFDAQTYAPTGALWTMWYYGSSVCVDNCHEYGPCPKEGDTCIGPAPCIANCTLNEIIVTTYIPQLRAFEVVRRCADGSTPAPSAPCPCPSSVTAPLFVAPANKVYVRGVATSTPATPPLAVQGTMTITAQAGPQDRVTLAGPSGNVVGPIGGPASLTLDTAQLPRGSYTVFAQAFNVPNACRGPAAQRTVFLESPTLRSSAQALRVEGNVPLHLIVGTIPVRPMDDLIGAESSVVTDPAVNGVVQLRAEVLRADAQHRPTPGAETHLAAQAATRSVALDGAVLLDQLCFTLTADPSCSNLPRVSLNERALGSDAGVAMDLVSAAGTASSRVDTDTGSAAASSPPQGLAAVAKHDVTPCPFTATASATAPVLPAVTRTVPLPVPCTVSAAGITATFGDVGQRSAPLAREAWATVLHITIDSGVYHGEVLLGTSYAGVSLGGSGLLQGPPGAYRAQDDFGLGGDAGSTPSSGPTLAPGTYSGSFEGSDRADAFRVAASPSPAQKLKIVLVPAHRVDAWLNPLPTAPSVGLAPRLMHLDLYDPRGNLRDQSTIVAPADSPSVELNVDEAGAWGVVITRLGSLVERAPYTLEVTLTPVPMLAGDGLPPAGDAPASCAGALPMTAAAHGTMDFTDRTDAWSVAAAGPGTGKLVVTLQPDGDVNGVDLDLEAYGPGCTFLGGSYHGRAALDVKGMAESLALTAAGPGPYFLKVLRVNGIGSYTLTATAA